MILRTSLTIELSKWIVIIVGNTLHARIRARHNALSRVQGEIEGKKIKIRSWNFPQLDDPSSVTRNVLRNFLWFFVRDGFFETLCQRVGYHKKEKAILSSFTIQLPKRQERRWQPKTTIVHAIPLKSNKKNINKICWFPKEKGAMWTKFSNPIDVWYWRNTILDRF